MYIDPVKNNKEFENVGSGSTMPVKQLNVLPLLKLLL